MNFKSMLCKSSVTIFLILVCSFLCAVLFTNAESDGVKMIQDISEPNSIVQIEEKIPLSELEKDFPTEKEVTLDTGEKEIIPVSWICESDYENEEYDSYVFEVKIPEGYMFTETCSSAFIKVVISGAEIPELYANWPANSDAALRFDEYLGVKNSVVALLESHENDDYYLGTKYYGDLDYPYACTRPNGEYEDMGYENPGMNCTGFVAAVMRKAGGSLSKIIEYSERGKYANAYNWYYTMHDQTIKSYRYTSIDYMFKYGRLEKGDIIYFEPDWTLDGVDCHMGFFWGDTPTDNKFWHSIKGEGNVITEVKSKSSYKYIYIFKNTPPGNLTLTKSSVNNTLTENNACYSLKGAVFGVYTSYNESTGKVSGRVGTLTTDKNGKTNTISLAAGTYYVKELTAPRGYIRSEEVKKVTLTSGKSSTITFKDEPQVSIVDFLLEKVDDETNANKPSGQASFENAQFNVNFYEGHYENASDLADVTPSYSWVLMTDSGGKCKLAEDYKVSGDEFIEDAEGNSVLPLGTLTIQEKIAPKGYLLNDELFIVQVTSENTGETLFHTVAIPETVMKGIVKIVKKDIQTREIIAVAGTEFRILDMDGNVVVSNIKTDETGTVVVSEKLPYGSYYLEEVSAPLGYIKCDKVKFVIHTEYSESAPRVLDIYNKSAPKIPATGDNTNLTFLVLLMLFSCTLLVKCVNRKNKS